MISTLGIVKIFDQQVERIKRMVEEEFSGCTAVFDRTAWPMVQFRLHDANGEPRSAKSLHFSISELEGFSDNKLRLAIQRFRRHSEH